MRTLAIAVTLALAAGSAFTAWIYEGKWGREGSGSGDFDQPWGVAVASNGNVYVVYAYNNRIQYFTPTGRWLGQWGSRGSGNGEFLTPKGIAIAPSGNVYVADYWSNHRSRSLPNTSKRLPAAT